MSWVFMAHMWEKIDRGIYKFDNAKNLPDITMIYEAKRKFSESSVIPKNIWSPILEARLIAL
jgi:hypothetical protein